MTNQQRETLLKIRSTLNILSEKAAVVYHNDDADAVEGLLDEIFDATFPMMDKWGEVWQPAST